MENGADNDDLLNNQDEEMFKPVQGKKKSTLLKQAEAFWIAQ